MSLRDKILAIDDTKVIPLEVPEWGETVYIRVMSGAERDQFGMSCQVNPKTGQAPLANLRARFAVLVLSDEKGTRIFSDADAVALGKKSGAALDRIFAAGQTHNGLTEEGIKELESKSASSQSADSGTSSPSA